MAMSVVAFGLFQIWHYAFLMGIFTHSLWTGWAFVMAIIHVFLWTADHAHDTPEMLFPFQVWWTFMYPIGWIASAAFVHFFGTPKLVDTDNIHVLKSGRPAVIQRGLVVLAFMFGWMSLFGAINFFMKRFSTTGMSPYDPTFSDDSSNLGGWLTVVPGGILVVGSTWWLGSSTDAMSRVTIKYIWVLASVIWTLFVHDYMTDVMFGGAVDWLPGGAQLAVFAVVMLILGPLLSIYIPVNTPLDPLFRHRRRTWRFFGAAFLAVVGAHIPSWVINVLTDGDEVFIFIALAVYTVVLCAVIWAVSYYMPGNMGTGYVLLKTRLSSKA